MCKYCKKETHRLFLCSDCIKANTPFSAKYDYESFRISKGGIISSPIKLKWDPKIDIKNW